MTLVTNIDGTIELDAAVTLMERFDWAEEVRRREPSAFELAFVMAHRWVDKKLGGLIVSQETLAKKSGLGERTVRRQMATLKAAGFLEQRRRRREAAVTFLVLDRQGIAALEQEEDRPSVAALTGLRPAISCNQDRPSVAVKTGQPQIGDEEKSTTCEPISRDIIPVKENPSAQAQRSSGRTVPPHEAETGESEAAGLAGGSPGLGCETEPFLPRCAEQKKIPVPQLKQKESIRAETVARLLTFPRRYAEPAQEHSVKRYDKLSDREEVGRLNGRNGDVPDDMPDMLPPGWPAAEREAWLKGWHRGRAELAETAAGEGKRREAGV